MLSETEELLWIASQENKTIPIQLIKFACNHNLPLSRMLEMGESDFYDVDKTIVSKFIKNIENIPIDSCQKIFDQIQKERITIVPYCDTYFPKGLRELEETKIPRLIYHQGKKIKIENGVAVVGTRNASTHAIEISRELGRILPQNNFMIVSGLARGIDAAAMRGSISVSGKTIAVLPWIHNPYPPEHEQLLEEIKQNGSVISENYVSAGSMDKYKFLQRNAIISALSEALIAVESSYSGGTRWQVELAISQKKTVIAIEPEISNRLAYDGYKQFVLKGALPAKNAIDVLEILNHRIKTQYQIDDYEIEDEDMEPLLTK